MGTQLIILEDTIVKVKNNTLKSEQIGDHAIYGYRKKGNEIVLDTKESNNIKAIFKLALDDFSNKAIAEELNKRDRKTATKEDFTERSVKYYLGEIRYTGLGDYPAIITLDNFKYANPKIEIDFK